MVPKSEFQQYTNWLLLIDAFVLIQRLRVSVSVLLTSIESWVVSEIIIVRNVEQQERILLNNTVSHISLYHITLSYTCYCRGEEGSRYSQRMAFQRGTFKRDSSSKERGK